MSSQMKNTGLLILQYLTKIGIYEKNNLRPWREAEASENEHVWLNDKPAS